ncbi:MULTISPECIES: ABC transporter permease [unclassified Agarivorans]|uniref:ABC transporter permease n=1 Tax=unclassified Agarivorans TaxID=2636026 RepID=UPI0026E2CA7F|nr:MULTISPECIES: ABC transporter permease [unclassified Agarivorans]MDO6684223.1 ABC transporter permease [Agarivorans sp. 3_MG-2023]MDO6714043.1 ABC transporter permease [Agarivorans sp. 2_MG-2023]
MLHQLRGPAKSLYQFYMVGFLVFLALPLSIVAVFAFNDSLFAALPWQGFTLDWFVGETEPKLGIFYDEGLLSSIGVSASIACLVTLLSLVLATANAWLFIRFDFPGKNWLYIGLLLPLVIPGVILGVAILVASSSLANSVEDVWGWELEWLRPGFILVVIGQVAFITTISTLVVLARLRKFDFSLEEAALNLGAGPWVAFVTVVLPFLTPALIGAAVVSFLMSFENFNTTLMLVGSDAPLTIAMYDRLREGSTPVLNAVSLLLMLGSAVIALTSMLFSGDKDISSK